MGMFFPGMDPYLEEPIICQGFHNRFVVHLADHLQNRLPARYITSVEERVFIEGPDDREVVPDVWIRRDPRAPNGPALAVADVATPITVRVPELELHENYIEILDRDSSQRTVSLIEVVSPTNKVPGPGRKSYLTKQNEVRHSPTHLVEVDLLRAGMHVLAVFEWVPRGMRPYDYLVCVNRAQETRNEFDLYAWGLREPVPKVGIPLTEGDPDVHFDLRAVLEYTYEAGRYQQRLRYHESCRPPLPAEDQAWANELIRQAGVLSAESKSQ